MVALWLNGRLICGTDIIQGFTLYCPWPSRNPSSDRTTNFGVIINIVGRHNQASWICFFLVFGWTTKTPGCEEVFRGLFPTNVTKCLLLGFRNTVGSFLLPLLLHPWMVCFTLKTDNMLSPCSKCSVVPKLPSITEQEQVLAASREVESPQTLSQTLCLGTLSGHFGIC